MIKQFKNLDYNIVNDMINGFVKAHHTSIEKIDGQNVLVAKNKKKNKVGVVIGNGSGHEPACIGFVGKNMLDANAYGGLFSAPGPQAIYEAIVASDQGKGVCLLVSNHAGDVMNSKMAEHKALSNGINVRSVILFDDIASASKDEDPFERRGSAGTLYAYKLVGSYSGLDVTLDQVCDFAEKVRNNVRTLSVSSISGYNPVTGEPFFRLEEDKYEIGMGVHGETMENKIDVCASYDLAQIMTDHLLEDRVYDKSVPISVLVNGMGRTTMMELYLFYNDVSKIISKKGYKLAKPLIGNFITTQDTAGLTLSFCELEETMQSMLLMETDAVAFRSV